MKPFTAVAAASGVVAFWQRQARRIDALSLRERAIMFLSIAATLVAVTDLMVVSPMLAAQKRLGAELQERNRELDDLRARVAANAQAADDTPQGRLRAALRQARVETAALDAETSALLARSAETARLAQLLERVLRRHERLTLLRLTTSPPPVRTAAQGAGLGLHSVELSIAGGYHELAGYLVEIERTLPGLRWGALRVTRDGDATVLALRLQLLGDLP